MKNTESDIPKKFLNFKPVFLKGLLRKIDNVSEFYPLLSRRGTDYNCILTHFQSIPSHRSRCP